jgi:hypothetical protein
MSAEGYKRKIEIAASPSKALRTLTEEVHTWWTTTADDSSAVGKRATFRVSQSYQAILIKDLAPERRDIGTTDGAITIAPERLALVGTGQKSRR